MRWGSMSSCHSSYVKNNGWLVLICMLHTQIEPGPVGEIDRGTEALVCCGTKAESFVICQLFALNHALCKSNTASSISASVNPPNPNRTCEREGGCSA
jgi:hypothetical protein